MTESRDVLARHCPNCGAQLDPSTPGRTIVCRYCGHGFQTAPEINPPQRVIVVTPGMRPLGAPVRRAATRSIFSGMFSLVVVGVVAFISLRSRSPGGILPSSIAEVSSEIAGAVPARFMWDTVAGPPMPAAVGGGVEGFVGRIRTRGDDTLWIAAFEGAKLGEVWKAGPLGTYMEGYQSTFAEVTGRSVLVTDYRANLHVYDLASGHETRTLKLTDRAKAMCASPDGKPRVWIQMSDEKNVVFDADTGTTTLASRPAWCPNVSISGEDCRGWLKRGDFRPGCRGPENAPKVPGFEADNVIEEGDLAVALGKKHPGTPTPLVVGFDPKTRAVRWQQPLASGDQAGVEASSTSLMDALAGGRFAAPYKVTSKGIYFTAFDARSGQRLWDVALEPQIGIDTPEGFAMSAARVYVMRTSSLEVYDGKTGTLVGTLGD
jgi:uncharacterized Zn-finger protein